MAGQEPVNGEEINSLISEDNKMIVRALLDILDVMRDVLDKLNDIKEVLKSS